MSSSTTHRVRGMTCDHCVRAVTDELKAIEGVTRVEVDLAAGEVTVAGDPEPTVDQVREAVDEAGYELVR
jgi:copper chaperone